MKQKLTANILIYAIILMMIPIHTLAEPELTPQPPEQILNGTIQQPAPTESPVPEPTLEPQDPNITYAAPGEAPAVDYAMLDNYNNNYNSMFGQEPEEEPLEETNTQNGNPEVEDNDPSINESGTDNFEPTTFDSPYNQINNQNENITLNQGSLNISNTILSLPGKNGLDLTLNLGYSSGSAVLDAPLYYYPGSPNFKNYFKVASQNCFFAPGWELSKSYIEMGGIEDLYKTGTRAMTLHLADGRTYQVYNTGVGPEYDIYGCNTKEFKLEHFSVQISSYQSTYHYLLTYKDGRTETFDWCGRLIQESDRYGNTINYSYEEEKLYRVNYKTYASNPAVYERTFATLSMIQDSLGREIHIEREMQRDAYGNSIQTVYFKMDGKNLAAAHFTLFASSYGPITVLSSIDTYAIDPSTNETKTLTTTYHYEEMIGAKTKNSIFYPGGNATIALTQIDYPTGAQTKYIYTNEKETTFDGIRTGQNETYKIATRWDIIDGEVSGKKDYQYINNSSGYPSSHRLTSPYYNGSIEGPGFRYYTRVTEPAPDSDSVKNTLYTFDNEHLKINEETFADSNQTILPLEGATSDSKQVVVQNNGVTERYRAYLANYRLVIEKNSDSGNEVIDVINKGNSTIVSTASNSLVLRLYDVKSFQNYLLLFCGFGYGGSINEYAVIKYNVTTNNYEFYGTPNNVSFGESFIQSGNTFYNVLSTKIYAFDASANTWNTLSSLPNNITSLQYVLAEHEGIVYLSAKHSYYESNRLVKLENGQLSDICSIDGKYGFSNSQGFFVLGNKIKKYNGDGTFTDFIDRLDGVDTSSYPFINNNGEIYVIKKNGSYYEELYRLDFQSIKWVYVTTLLIKPYYFNALSDGTSIMFFSGNADTCSSGYEKINPYQLNYANRKTSNFTYDEYKLPACTSVTTYGPAGQKKTSTSTATYDLYKNLISQTDVLGRQNTYTYDTGTPGSGHYHILTQSVENVGTDKEITTTNTLSSDNKKITLSVTNYGTNKLLSLKNEYSTSSPGNIIRRTSYETSEDTPLNVVEYEYSTDYGEAYMTKQTVLVDANNEEFTQTNHSFITQFTYDSFGRRTTTTDELGRTYTNEYFSNGWVKKTSMPDGENYKEYTYQINDNGINKIITNISGQYSTENIYDNMGRMVEQKAPDTDNVLQTAGVYNYDVNGRVFQQTNLYTRLNFEFDYLGRTVKLTTSNPDGTDPSYKTAAYDDYIQKVTVTDEDGKSQMIYLDDAGRTTEEWQKQPVTENGVTTDQYVKVADYTYDVANNVTTITDANGNSVAAQYDRRGNLLQSTDAKNQITSYQYDIKNNLLQMTTPGGSTSSYEYDGMNRSIKGTDAMGESIYKAYDASGRLIKTKDRNGVITTNSYKENTDLLASTTSGDITTNYTYDTIGNILEAADQTGTSTYTYHNNKMLERITKPDGKYISYTYDVLGNVTSVTDYDEQTNYYTYEKGGRLKSISSSLTGTAEATYHYYDNGSLSYVAYANGLKTQYTYDSANRVSQVINEIDDNIQNTYDYTYDQIGNQITKKETAADGTVKTSTYTYDELNRIQTEADPSGMVKAYAYDANNNIQSVTATAPSNELSAAPVMPQVQNPDSTEAGNPLSASLNLAPNLNETSEISNAVQSAENTAITPQNYVMTYTYDSNNRMLSQKKAENGIEYFTKMGYDKNGNMTSRQRSSIGGPVGENTNMEISIGTMQSNPGSDSVAETFSYNALNQMTGYQNSNGTNASYTYDATGMRTSKTVNGALTKFYYDGIHIINEGNGEEITTSNFIGLSGIEGRKNSADPGMAYFMKDAHGDVRGVTDSGGNIIKNYSYDIWGNKTEESDSPYDNPFRYTGEYTDEESGLTYLRARYYDSSISRFTQEDPATSGQNWYAYAGNNPNMFADPLGLMGRSRDYYANDSGERAMEMARFLVETYIAYISTTDPVTVLEDGDNVTIIAYLKIGGDRDAEIDGKNCTELTIEGIQENWNHNDYDGKKVTVYVIDLNDGKEHIVKERQKSVNITIADTYHQSEVKNWMSISDPGEMFLYTGDNYADPNGSPGNRLGPKVKWSIDEFKRTAAHEFGHVLGIADGFGYGYNQETFFGDIIALMSSQWDAKATRLDLELALKAHRTNSWQWWDENKDLISKFGIQRK